jgi:hypothetical protein
MAGHTGQYSQLFPVTTGRNAQFLATVVRDASSGKSVFTGAGVLAFATPIKNP